MIRHALCGVLEYVHHWQGRNPGLGKGKGAWSFRSRSLHGQTESGAVAPKKKDFVTLVDAHGKEHTIKVRSNGEKLAGSDRRN